MASITAPAQTELPGAERGQVAARRPALTWLGVVPFLLYVSLFLLVPSIWLAVGAFQTDSGAWTLANVRALSEPQYSDAFKTSIELSLVTALAGGFFGLFVAYAAVKEGSPHW